MTNRVSRFLKDGSDSAAIKYGLIVAVISLAIVTAVLGIGKTLTVTSPSTATTTSAR